MSAVDDTKQPALGCTETAESACIPATCRARPVGGITEFAECLVAEQARCRHRVLFGNARFCWHPRREEIVARTALP
jgi:hypothetical protein